MAGTTRKPHSSARRAPQRPDDAEVESPPDGTREAVGGVTAASLPTVTTKLEVPPEPRHLVLRERLLETLDRGCRERLVLLSAPAGAGKTALLSSWMRMQRSPGVSCWLSLDEDDNDAVRLIADLQSSLRGAGAAPPGSALERLPQLTEAPPERALPLLVNALAELPGPVIAVLDDVHVLTDAAATGALDYLVRHLPTQLHLVLAGRADPPLPIERLRVRGELTELRGEELAFDRAETAELCRQLELVLADSNIDLLWARTEGWAAALRLAAFSLRGHPDPTRFLAELSGSDRAVADYLVSEVLAHIAAERREFLLRIALTETVSPELAEALTGREDSAVVLAALERSGAPVHAAHPDGHGDCYRLHPLFRELLRAHLRHDRPDEVPQLHRRAAHWYAAAGQTASAIRHALNGGDWPCAGELVAQNWLEVFLTGRSSPLRASLARLPAKVLEADPHLAAAFAGSRLQVGDLVTAERHLTLARRGRSELPAEGQEQLDLMLAVVGVQRARLRVQAGEVERLARKLTTLSAPAGAHPGWTALRSFALANLGATYLWSGEPRAAVGPLQEALALATEHHHEPALLDCMAQLALVRLLDGELGTAHELSARAVELAEQRGWSEGPSVACAYLARAAGAYRSGAFEHAEGLASHAAAAARSAEAPLQTATAALQALALAAAGPRSAARGVLKLRALRVTIARAAELPRFLERALVDIEARVLLAAGEVAQARAVLAAARAAHPSSATLLVRSAALELRAGAPEAAAQALQAVLAAPAAPAIHLEAWLLQALLEQGCGEERAASEALEGALALAEREPYRDAFLLSGTGVAELLETQARRGTEHPALLEVLLEGVSGARHPEPVTLAEPLTEREQRILRYLPTMLSNAEIGAEVFVSLNTVKTHLRSIYRKLGANGRADAVEKARAAGLLPSGIRRPRVAQRSYR
jgi:LuxR family maltose regulon positive regulatory protein